MSFYIVKCFQSWIMFFTKILSDNIGCIFGVFGCIKFYVFLLFGASAFMNYISNKNYLKLYLFRFNKIKIIFGFNGNQTKLQTKGS